MENSIFNSNYMPADLPYQIIKYGHATGIQVGTQIVSIQKNGDARHPFRIETHSYPVIMKENTEKVPANKQLFTHHSMQREIWQNVEVEKVSTLCYTNSHLPWQEFVELLWNDLLRQPREASPDICLYKTLYKYGVTIDPIPSAVHIIHLTTQTIDGHPTMVCSQRSDIVALNVHFSDNTKAIAGSIQTQVAEYKANFQAVHKTSFPMGKWRLKYETNEDSLRPLVELMNSPHVPQVVMGFFSVTCVDEYENEAPQTNQEEQNVESESLETINIDENRLITHFKLTFKKNGGFDTLVSILKAGGDGRKMALIANQIYKSKYFIKADFGPFAAWYRFYCDVVGCKYHPSYKPSKLKPTKEEAASLAFLHL